VKVETKFLEHHEASLTVEVEPERVEKALKGAARKISRQVKFPGFRKGKVPYHIVLRQVGEEALFDEALDTLGQEVYREALEESELVPYAPGSLIDVQRDPTVITYTVPLSPEVDLGNYRKVRVKRKKVKVGKKDVQEALEMLRAENAVLETVERGIEYGDVATLDYKGTMVREEDGEPETLIERDGSPILIRDDMSFPAPGFAEKVLGMKAGEERSFTVVTPDDFLEESGLGGQDFSFEVKCVEVRLRDLPELDDEFAQTVGDFDNLKALRENMQKELEEHMQRQADEQYADEVLETIIEKGSFSYPPVMLEEWIDRSVGDFEQTLSAQQNMTLDDYFSIADTDMETLRGEMREDVEENLRRVLAMGKLVEEERLSVDDAEIKDEIETMLLSAGQQAALARHFFQSEDAKDEIRNSLLIQKIRERLVAIASGDAPSLESLAAQTNDE